MTGVFSPNQSIQICEKSLSSCGKWKCSHSILVNIPSVIWSLKVWSKFCEPVVLCWTNSFVRNGNLVLHVNADQYTHCLNQALYSCTSYLKRKNWTLWHLGLFSEHMPALFLNRNSQFFNKQDVTKGKDLKTRNLPALHQSKFGIALNQPTSTPQQCLSGDSVVLVWLLAVIYTSHLFLPYH